MEEKKKTEPWYFKSLRRRGRIRKGDQEREQVR